MREIELKFQVPEVGRPAVRRAVATATARTVRLQARYFDTPDGRLAAAGIALRLRKEGPRWVQTLKTRGDGVMQRGEHEVVLPGRQPPQLDPGRHAGTPAGRALLQALQGGAALAECFATDIRRTRRTVRSGGALVEIAFDQGEIRAGAQRQPVCELEFELLRGPPAAVPLLAARWVERHAIWLDPRSKAQAGEHLARGAAAVAVKATPPLLHDGMAGDEAFRAMVAGALEQVLANACQLAGGSEDPEHLHQCRVGMRRLRCALRDFAPLAAAGTATQGASWQAQISAVFRRLGGARDRDALRESLLPQLAAAGAPLADLPAAPARDEDPGAVMRGRAANQLWLALLGSVHAPAAGAAQPSPLRARVRPILHGLHRQVCDDAAVFATLDEAGQHRTRKRLKRLRYGAEMCSSLYPAKAVSRYLAVLRPAQDALGEANDLVVARTLFAPQVDADPRAWFVLGWLAARRPVVVAQCNQALAGIAQAHGFWRRAAEV